jgi:putative nucleotidyltransferase with HDIG domain
VIRIDLTRFGTPRMIVRTVVATFGTILLILGAVAVILTIETNRRAERAVTESLESTERLFSTIERQRTHGITLQALAIAESPGLSAAMGGLDVDGSTQSPDALAAVQRELDRLADRLDADAMAIVGTKGAVLVSAGRDRSAWAPGYPAQPDKAPVAGNGSERVVRRATGVFRVVAAPLPGGAELQLATALDDEHAESLASLSRRQIALTIDRELLATTLQSEMRQALGAQAGFLPDAGVVTLGETRYAVRRVLSVGAVEFHALLALDGPTRRARTSTLSVLLVVALGALLIGGVASLWLARSVSEPIDRLAQQMRQMTGVRDFSRQLRATGSSHELDELTAAFNQMMSAVVAAEAETEAAYVGAIKALAAALDCRDRYTAGHSERVSALSVMIGRQLRLEADELDVLRLGALLHDIGKIGILDNVLTKAGPLTAEEFEIIKTHPTLGAHILRQVPFLHRHLPIVELHHERPDGRGYPHGLLGHATPLKARIVHVADAFDAMTTARAYRPAQTVTHAINELWRYAGSQFDAEVVEAFVAAWSAVPVSEPRPDAALILRGTSVLPFPARTAEEAS